MAHLLDHHAGDRAAIPLRRSGCKQVALLLDAGKFSVPLVDDHVHERVPHLLGGNLAQILPLVAAFVGAELNLPGFDRSVERVEVESLDTVLVDADFLAPFVEYPDPLAKAADLCYFAWHKTSGATAQVLIGFGRGDGPRALPISDLRDGFNRSRRSIPVFSRSPNPRHFAVNTAGRFST